MLQKKKMNLSAYDNGSSEKGNRFGGGGFSDFFNPKKVNLEKYKVKSGKNIIDIIPFNADKNHPLVVSGKCEEGDVLYSLDIYVHKSVGASQSNIPCLKQFGKKCPICDEATRLFNSNSNESKSQAKKLFAKRRVVYVVHDLIDDKYCFWENGWASVEKEIMQECSIRADANGAKLNVMDWEEGKSIEFYGVEETFDGHKYNKPTRFNFLDRKPLSDEVLNHSVDLSSTLNMMNEEQMERVISGEIVSNASEDSSAETSAETTAPTKPIVEESVPNTSFDDAKPIVEEKKEEPKPTETSSGGGCPYGHNLGEADDHAECVSCKMWDKCIS